MLDVFSCLKSEKFEFKKKNTASKIKKKKTCN